MLEIPRTKGRARLPTAEQSCLAYLEADYEAIEAKVTPPSDEEVARYTKTIRVLSRKDSAEDTEKLDSDKPTVNPKTMTANRKRANRIRSPTRTTNRGEQVGRIERGEKPRRNWASPN